MKRYKIRGISKKIYVFYLLAAVCLMSGCRGANGEMTVREAKKEAVRVLKNVVSADCDEDHMEASYRDNGYPKGYDKGTMTKDRHAYWRINCSLEKGDDYQLWFDASSGRVTHIFRYPKDWFDEDKEAGDYTVTPGGPFTAEEISAAAAAYCDRAEYENTGAEPFSVNVQDSILLDNFEGGKTEWPVNYYNIAVGYEDGPAATIALMKDDLSLLAAWYAPYW